MKPATATTLQAEAGKALAVTAACAGDGWTSSYSPASSGASTSSLELFRSTRYGGAKRPEESANVILSSQAILYAWEHGEIAIDPFDFRNLNPNSYNYRLGHQLTVVSTEGGGTISTQIVEIPDDGYVLRPRQLYLANTLEKIGSSTYVTTLLGRSSIGRLGLFLNITADLGHCGCAGRWTLEITAIQPLRIYREMRIGQVAFWEQIGSPDIYAGRYLGDLEARPCKDMQLLRMINGAQP